MKQYIKGSFLVAGSIALEALYVLFSREEEKIRSSFPSFFVEHMQIVLQEYARETEPEKEKWMSFLNEASVRETYGIRLVRPVGEGGIFNALWNACEALESGCEIELDRIPVLQESVEICELFDINPYYTSSKGSVLIAAERGSELQWHLKDLGIHADIIGIYRPGRARIIRSGPDLEHVRCLDRPQKDSLSQFLHG